MTQIIYGTCTCLLRNLLRLNDLSPTVAIRRPIAQNKSIGVHMRVPQKQKTVTLTSPLRYFDKTVSILQASITGQFGKLAPCWLKSAETEKGGPGGDIGEEEEESNQTKFTEFKHFEALLLYVDK